MTTSEQITDTIASLIGPDDLSETVRVELVNRILAVVRRAEQVAHRAGQEAMRRRCGEMVADPWLAFVGQKGTADILSRLPLEPMP